MRNPDLTGGSKLVNRRPVAFKQDDRSRKARLDVVAALMIFSLLFAASPFVTHAPVAKASGVRVVPTELCSCIADLSTTSPADHPISGSAVRLTGLRSADRYDLHPELHLDGLQRDSRRTDGPEHRGRPGVPAERSLELWLLVPDRILVELGAGTEPRLGLQRQLRGLRQLRAIRSSPRTDRAGSRASRAPSTKATLSC